MEQLSNEIKKDQLLSLHERTFALINTGTIDSSGEHWIGAVMKKRTNSSGYFDFFGGTCKWLENTLNNHFDHVHKTKHVVQSESVSTCGLHTIYFIIRMMDPMNKSSYVTSVNMGDYVRLHYGTKDGNHIIKDRDVVNHLSRKFHTNFALLLKK